MVDFEYIGNDRVLDGTELWLHLINRYKLDPREALSSMESNGKNIAEVLVYLESILESYTIKHKGE